MPKSVELQEFLLSTDPILDVRSPSEFIQGHIPKSHSFPLFDDQERAKIGTAYKRQSRQEAIEWGLQLVGGKIDHLLHTASSLLHSIGNVLCWRGGMRSGFVGQLLEQMGYTISTLQGGYKVFRKWVLHQLDHQTPPRLFVLGGLTGSGKTEVLQGLREVGEQVIDLEQLANHRGSAFGGIGLSPQPSQEHFENELAFLLSKLNVSKPIWIEDESRLVGHCHLPQSLYHKMSQAPLFYLPSSLEKRVKHLLHQYGSASLAEFLEATTRITKRLGSQLSKEVKLLFETEQKEKALELLLKYYDKSYHYQLQRREKVYTFENHPYHHHEWADALQTFYKQQKL